jgi:predicted CoA-binding protein
MKRYRTTRQRIDAFFQKKSVALVGVSRDDKQFANVVMRTLRQRGFTVYPINPHAETVGGQRCYPRIDAIPDSVGAVGVFIPPALVPSVLAQVHTAGIKNVWLQQGTESEEAIAFCNEHGIDVVAGECMLMFAEPVGTVHRVHRWFKELTGGLEKM